MADDSAVKTWRAKWSCTFVKDIPDEAWDEFARERVLAEAKWWRHLVIMHEESYFAVEGDKRIKQIEEQS
jgi:hypothetical protein